MNSKQLTIRAMDNAAPQLMEDLLYASIFQPDKADCIPRTVIELPEVKQYIVDFGQYPSDYGLLAEVNGKIAGGVWVRILNGAIKGFGYIDDVTPELAIAVFSEYRASGIGAKLINTMLEWLKNAGYKQTSLSVQKENYATAWYQKLGYRIVKETDADYVMVLAL